MLIGTQWSDLSLRSRCLLVVASLCVLVSLALQLLAPEPAVRLMQAWLATIVLLGAYWLSFLADFRNRLGRGQLIIASLFAVLPWILVITLVLGYPQVLFPAGSAVP